MRWLIVLGVSVVMCMTDRACDAQTTAQGQGVAILAKRPNPAYKKFTLDCGCTLLVRTDIECCKKAYPEDLGKAMEEVIVEAKKNAEEIVPFHDERPAGGTYERIWLDCSCGLIVYKPDSCCCFDKEHYPKLVAALNELYRLANKHRAKPQD